MRGQLIVTGLDGFEAFGRLTGRHGEQDGLETGASQTSLDGFGVSGRDIPVGDDGATIAEVESGALLAQTGEETGADVNAITAVAERDVDAAHPLRIGRKKLAASFRLHNDIQGHKSCLPRFASGINMGG